MAHFVFMLTHSDRTVDNAAEIVPTLADTGLRYIGFKDVGADLAAARAANSELITQLNTATRHR